MSERDGRGQFCTAGRTTVALIGSACSPMLISQAMSHRFVKTLIPQVQLLSADRFVLPTSRPITVLLIAAIGVDCSSQEFPARSCRC